MHINENVLILKDVSAGSNAITLLVKKDKKFYRKYAFDVEAEKLKTQIRWIEEHQKDVPLPLILNKENELSYTIYDMPMYESAMSMFQFIHTVPIEKSWSVLGTALKDIDEGLHKKNIKPSDKNTIDNYICCKVYGNVRKILENKYIVDLERNENIIVNGRKLPTLHTYREMLSGDYLYKVFEKDIYADIHGDLSIENIVCFCDNYDNANLQGLYPKGYYFIDPNSDNIHNSPFLDYAKLLQSLHGNYEFLMKVSDVSIKESSVEYMVIKSQQYDAIYHKYQEFLKNKYTKTQLLSIYYHEIVHWIRLLPYKNMKNEKLAVVFYTGLLNVLFDVWELENGKR